MLQAGSLLCFDKLVEEGTDPAYAEKLIQFGWETITEALKQGGITLMMDRLSNPAKLSSVFRGVCIMARIGGTCYFKIDGQQLSLTGGIEAVVLS